MFDHFEHMMDDSFFRGTMGNFPPYNIVKTGENTYDVELALAGFNKKDIEVEYKENMLTVKSKKQDKQEETDEDGNIIHRGISKRMFSKSFTIANDVEVKGAELKDGLLKVSMERIIPEHKKAKSIEIK
jgi:molecular chaperone IbpA